MKLFAGRYINQLFPTPRRYRSEKPQVRHRTCWPPQNQRITTLYDLDMNKELRKYMLKLREEERRWQKNAIDPAAIGDSNIVHSIDDADVPSVAMSPWTSAGRTIFMGTSVHSLQKLKAPPGEMCSWIDAIVFQTIRSVTIDHIRFGELRINQLKYHKDQELYLRNICIYIDANEEGRTGLKSTHHFTDFFKSTSNWEKSLFGRVNTV